MAPEILLRATCKDVLPQQEDLGELIDKFFIVIKMVVLRND